MDAVTPKTKKVFTAVLGVGVVILALMGVFHFNPVQKALAIWLFAVTEIVVAFYWRRAAIFWLAIAMLVLAQVFFFSITRPSL